MPTTTDEARIAIDRYCAAWRGGDLVGLIECYADDFALHYFGTSRFAGDHLGRDTALAVLAEVSAIAPRELVAIDEVLVGPTAAAIVVRERLTRDGATHELRRVLRYRTRGDKLAECWLYDEDQALVDRLWA
ncbi:MAG: nuclear transport factor 2 family protein [Actinomycetota bacterium]